LNAIITSKEKFVTQTRCALFTKSNFSSLGLHNAQARDAKFRAATLFPRHQAETFLSPTRREYVISTAMF
jgi:hypothetical protein